jgi:hypothetical protein
MIKHVCDNCGVDITDDRTYSVEVKMYEPNGIKTTWYRYPELCGRCILSVTTILRAWNTGGNVHD